MNKEAEENIKCTLSNVPFKVSLNFKYLINDIENVAKDKNHPMYLMAQNTIKLLDANKQFLSSITNYEILEENKDVLQSLLTFLINPFNDKTNLSAVFIPFAWEPIYSTQYYKDVFFDVNKVLELESSEINNIDKFLVSVLYHAYLLILDKIYKIDLYKDKPITFRQIDQKTNLIKFYSTEVLSQYVRVHANKNHRKLSSEELKNLINRENDLDYWNEMIPLENFEFSGLMKVDYYDVTYDYVISQLKSVLLDRNSIVTNAGFEQVRKWIRSLIENSELEIGLVAINDFNSSSNKKFIWRSIVPYTELSCVDYAGSIFEEAYTSKKIIITDDFKNVRSNIVVEAYLKRGIRSHVIIPLLIDDEVVGALEFACSKPGNLTMIQVKRLKEVLPMFALAINRTKLEWNDKVKAVIQKEFTAIHPTVEWKFKETVEELLNEENCDNDIKILEQIVFNDVIPLYGASDIRASSIERNKAIQADLKDQLLMVENILNVEEELQRIPMVSNLCYKINKYIETVNQGLKAGDEITIIDFLKKEIEPIFNILKERFIELHDVVVDYFEKLDPSIGVYYNKRKDFEESLTLINEHISDILDKEQVKIQRVYPHYFEKYKTDGIEFNAYIGQSLVKDIPYNDIYLKNLRLWQLMVMISIARRIRKIQSSLKTKLDISQLILVHSSPLSIAFRQDEKKFDVDGAYNIRYEITKKRIDKALVKNSNERVTQIGKIAIIYSYAEEIEEYKRYIEFLISQKIITNKIEDLELEDLKGASGLKALRIEIDYKNTEDGVELDSLLKVGFAK